MLGWFPPRLVLFGVGLVVAVGSLNAQNVTCACDPAQPETLKERQCSLTREAMKQPDDIPVFFLKDNNPRKPNRWLALPRPLGGGMQTLRDLSPQARTALWQAAIDKSKELFGPDDWAVAYNGEKVRTQCHLHIHIGKFIRATLNDRFKVVRRIKDIPVPQGDGIWIRPCNGNLCVHQGDQIAETVLVR